jgi:hypothetical protein
MIYVDPLLDYSTCTGRPAPDLWCHLVTDGPVEELHRFAARMGLRRAWFQDKPGAPHYDLNPRGRRLAVEMGAEEVTAREMVAALHRGREEN